MAQPAEALDASKAVKAAVLDATKWKRLAHVGRGKVVDVGHAGLEALADCARARLAAKHTRSEPKVAVVRQRDHLVVGVKPDHRHDWPKDLLLPDAHAAPHAQQHGRRVEDAFARRQLPSSQQLGALCDRVIDELLHLFRQARHRHAANVRRPVAKRRALPHARHRRHHASHKRVEHLVVHKEALAAGAVLAAVEERRLDRDLHHRLDIRVVQDDDRVLATQLQHHRRQGVCRRCHHLLSHLR
mmetsp:Transcript_35274/g.104337  ORF Transcript_35274/g.104337 Transcript_35274/m.104337 type:complete len:243 (+) Transcript_35274:1679-2407(+)